MGFLGEILKLMENNGMDFGCEVNCNQYFEDILREETSLEDSISVKNLIPVLRFICH